MTDFNSDNHTGGASPGSFYTPNQAPPGAAYGALSVEAYPTIISSGPPPGDGALQSWCICNLVLSLLLVGMYSLAAFAGTMVVSTGRSLGAATFFAVVGDILAIGMLSGSIGGLMRKDWGRVTMVLAGVAVLVFLLADLLYSVGFMSQPLPVGASPFAQGVQQGAHLGALIFDPLKMLYIALLIRFMTSSKARSLVR